MELNRYIQSTIQQIKAEQEREISTIRDKVTREKIVPFNQEIDRDKSQSIAMLDKWLSDQKMALTGTYNESLAKLQAKYNEDKKIVEETAEKKKIENANAVIETAIYEIKSKCEETIAKLNAIE